MPAYDDEAVAAGRGQSKEYFKQLSKRCNIGQHSWDCMDYKGYMDASTFVYSVGNAKNLEKFVDFVGTHDVEVDTYSPGRGH